MAVFLHASTSDISFEVGEYERFSRGDSEKAPVKTWRSKLGRFNVVLLGLGLLCVVQAILNICLRLSLRDASVVSSTPGSITQTQAPPIKATREAEAERCPQDWLMFDSSCYYISTQRKTWDDSRRDCLQRGADLVVIGNRQEQAFLTGFTEVAWVGMTDRRREGRFVWVDRTPVNRNQLQWARGQPDNSNGAEDCGDLYTRIDFIGLNDSACTTLRQWICERKLS
ncbi:CD209 antigen-like protein C [Sphaeramia orbicularis]|uniref:CD209 antigen-like protein C n=1 Tax=Sphaeramia orbicularis TaxID=375764 RepID=UPI001181156B|nr:CD209 antigen-like protein C [Sphaeramia orbicularis]